VAKPYGHAARRSPTSARTRETLYTALPPLAVALLAGALYHRSLTLAFFNDDPTGNFHWMEQLSSWQLLTSSAGYGFYRPLVFILWKSMLSVFGGYWAPGYHALPLLLHMANVALLWVLAYDATNNRAYASTAALAFASFPLSYEAVGYVAAMFHPLLAFWALLTLLFYRRARRTRAAGWLAAALVTTVLGLFTHENGVVVPVLLLGRDWLATQPAGWRRLLNQPALWFLLAPLLFGILWVSIPKSSGQGLQPLASIGRNAVAFSQVLSYPLLPFLGLHAADTLWLVTVGLAVLLGAYILARWAQVQRVYGFALLWIAASALPSLLILKPVYLYGSPRLYYLTSLGAALLWGVPTLWLGRLLPTGPPSLHPGAGGEACLTAPRAWRVEMPRFALRHALQSLMVLFLVVPPLDYIRCQMHFLGRASDLVRALARRTSQAPAGREIVWVNLPFYFSSCQRYPAGCLNPYPFAPVGAVVLPPYASVADLARVNGGGAARPAQSVLVKEYAPGWSLHASEAISTQTLHDDAATAQVYVLDFAAWEWFDLSAAWRSAADSRGVERARFEQVALQEATVSRQADGLFVTLNWHVLRAPGRALTAFVHLYDAAGALVAQHDGPPASGFVPAWMWQAGDLVVDLHRVKPAQPLATGTYTLVAGLYDSNTGQRLVATSGDGARLANDVAVLRQISWPE
jgi:hypothetical protein